MSLDSETFEAFCIVGPRGTLSLSAADVREVSEADGDAPSLPWLDLAGVLGPGAPGAPLRRIRVDAAEVAPFELVTSAALSVRRIARSALSPVPHWLAPLVEPLGVRELLLSPDALLLFVEPRRLASLCEGAAREPGGGQGG